MSTQHCIANSEFVIAGSMICETCKKEIEGDYLIVEHYISKRGNEDDYNELFCYDCSKDRKVWKEYFHKIQLRKKERDIKHSKNLSIAFEMIKKASWIEFSEDEDCNQCIILYK